MNVNSIDILYKINFLINHETNKTIKQPIDINNNGVIIEIDRSLIQYDISKNPVIYDNIQNFTSLTHIDKLLQ